MKDKNSRSTISRRQMMKMAAFAATSGASLFASRNSGGGSLLIRRGHLVTANKRWDADVRIRDGKVVEIDRNLQRKDEERVIDALGLQVLPGGIDPHAHLLPPWVDDYESGSKGAVAGGVTSIGCMVSSQKGETFADALAREARRAQEQALADIFLHPIIGAPSKEVQELLPQLPKTGHSDIKIFMTSPTFAENQALSTDS